MFTLPVIPGMSGSSSHSASMVDGSSSSSTLPRCQFGKIPCLCINPHCPTCISNPAVQAVEQDQQLARLS